MRAQETAWLVVLVLLVGGAGVASAQTQLGGVNIEGQIEAGGRFYAERPSPTHRAKFEEYRDLPAGLFLQGFDLRLSRPDESYSAELSGSKWGQRDQDYFLSVGRLGQWLPVAHRPVDADVCDPAGVIVVLQVPIDDVLTEQVRRPAVAVLENFLTLDFRR